MTLSYWILSVFGVLLLGLVALAVFAPRTFVQIPFRILLGILYRKRVLGLENFPEEGGCLVVSNHVSWIDGILILWMMPRNVRFVVDGANFDNPLVRYLGNAFDCIFMKSGPKSIARALIAAREGLNHGDVIGVFPEGTLTRTGQLQAFRPGIQKNAEEDEGSGCPNVARRHVGEHLQFFRWQILFQMADEISAYDHTTYWQATGQSNAA